MLKEIIICIVIILTIYVGNNILQDYTRFAVEEINSNLLSLRKEIENPEEKSNEKKTKEQMSKIYTKWQEMHGNLAYYIEHDELEKVETDITALKSYIDVSEYKEAISELDKSVFVLKHIEEKYAFTLENIF